MMNNVCLCWDSLCPSVVRHLLGCGSTISISSTPSTVTDFMSFKVIGRSEHLQACITLHSIHSLIFSWMLNRLLRSVNYRLIPSIFGFLPKHCNCADAVWLELL